MKRVRFKISKKLDKKIIPLFIKTKAGGIDFSNSIFRLHPILKNLNSKGRLYYIDDYYKRNRKSIVLKKDKIKKRWYKIENIYFDYLKELFGLRPQTYICFLSIINSNPRWVSKNEFTVGYKMKDDLIIKTICHELLHFYFYNYFRLHFKRTLSDRQKWVLSEIFNVIILNQTKFKKLHKSEELGYPDHQKYIKRFKKIYYCSSSSKDFLIKAIRLIKIIVT